MSELPQKELILESREVAEMVGKRHDNLLRDINKYVNFLTNSNLRSLNFFKNGCYQDDKGQTRPCFWITKKGCEFIANKLTGQKGAQFTATYINKFHEMEDKLKPQSIEDLIIMQAQSMKQLKDQVRQQGEQIQAVKQSFAEVKGDWRQYVNKVFASIGQATGDYQGYRNESYIILNRRARADIERRLENKIERMNQRGARKSDISKINKLDIIAEEPRLKEIYIKIVQEFEVKYL